MSPASVVKFRLYVAGDAQNSTNALLNLTALCKECLPDRHEIEVIDVLREQQRALKDGILMTPTLIKFAPLPVRRIVGTLSQKDRVLASLGISSFAA